MTVDSPRVGPRTNIEAGNGAALSDILVGLENRNPQLLDRSGSVPSRQVGMLALQSAVGLLVPFAAVEQLT